MNLMMWVLTAHGQDVPVDLPDPVTAGGYLGMLLMGAFGVLSKMGVLPSRGESQQDELARLRKEARDRKRAEREEQQRVAVGQQVVEHLRPELDGCRSAIAELGGRVGKLEQRIDAFDTQLNTGLASQLGKLAETLDGRDDPTDHG